MTALREWSEMTQQVGAGAGPEDFCFRSSLLPCQENRHRSAMKMQRLMKAVIVIPPHPPIKSVAIFPNGK